MGPWNGATVDGETVWRRDEAGTRRWGYLRYGGGFSVHGCRSFTRYSRTFWGGIPDRPCPGEVFNR